MFCGTNAKLTRSISLGTLALAAVGIGLLARPTTGAKGGGGKGKGGGSAGQSVRVDFLLDGSTDSVNRVASDDNGRNCDGIFMGNFPGCFEN